MGGTLTPEGYGKFEKCRRFGGNGSETFKETITGEKLKNSSRKISSNLGPICQPLATLHPQRFLIFVALIELLFKDITNSPFPTAIKSLAFNHLSIRRFSKRWFQNIDIFKFIRIFGKTIFPEIIFWQFHPFSFPKICLNDSMFFLHPFSRLHNFDAHFWKQWINSALTNWGMGSSGILI